MKVCCTCKVELPLSEFHRKSASKDGLNGRCKSCKRKENAEQKEKYRSNPENRDREREYRKGYRKLWRSDPENYAKHLEYNREYKRRKRNGG